MLPLKGGRVMTGCWRGSRTCFMLSVLVYLALPIPCDSYLICVPPQVGDSWTYRRETVDRLSQRAETEIDTVTVSVVGTEQVGDQEYYRVHSTHTLSGDVALYRASADGAIWLYDARLGKEVLYSDLWRVGADQRGEVRYEGVLLGRSTENDESERGRMELIRRGPLEISVDDFFYSGVFEFWIEEEYYSEFFVGLYVHPEIGVLKKGIYTYVHPAEYSDVWELISFNRQPNVPSVVRDVTWGTVKRRHMSQRLR